MADLNLKQGEQKTIQFTVKDGGVAQNVEGGTFTYVIEDSDNVDKVTKSDGDFTKTQASVGVVTVQLTSTDLDQDAGLYQSELKYVAAGGAIDKSADISVEILRART